MPSLTSRLNNSTNDLKRPEVFEIKYDKYASLEVMTPVKSLLVPESDGNAMF
jgi:hypothetical protein